MINKIFRGFNPESWKREEVTMKQRSRLNLHTNSTTTKFGLIAVTAAILVVAVIFGWGIMKDTGKTAETTSELALPQSRLIFLENRGQWDEKAKFVARNGWMSAWFERDAFTLQLEKPDAEEQLQGVVTRLTFAGASDACRLEGETKQPGTYNFLVGKDSEKWQSRVAAYNQIVYRSLYSGVDLRVRDNAGRLEYDILLEPGADLSQVVVQCTGVEGLEIEPDGSLLIQTPLGPIHQKPPMTWHELRTGERQPVDCSYRLLDETHFGFFVEELNPDLALVIDPGLEWSTFLGGSGDDGNDEWWGSNTMVLTENDEVLITGRTRSTDFPTTAGAYNTTHGGGNWDIFVSLLDPDLIGPEQLVWSTYLGGGGHDESRAIDMDESGNIVIAGFTDTTDFPISVEAFNTTYNGGGSDGFIAVLDATGSNLLFAKFIGGEEDDVINDLTIDASNNLMITGHTSSSDFPVTPDAYDTSYNGNQDGFVSRIDLDQTGSDQLAYSTYLGGDQEDWIQEIKLGSSGTGTETVMIAGYGASRDFPTTPGAYSETYSGGYADAYIAELDLGQPGEAQLIYSTFFGGTGEEKLSAMDLDSAGRYIFTGTTSSPTLPLTPGAFDERHNGRRDMFVSRLDANLSGKAQLTYATFIGTWDHDAANALVVDKSGAIVVVGFASGADWPVTDNAYDQTHHSDNAVVFRLNPDKTGSAQLEYSTILGGDHYLDYGGFAVTQDSAGDMIIAGKTTTNSYPTTPGAYDRTLGGSSDVVIAKISIDPLPPSQILYARFDGSLIVDPVSSPGSGQGVFKLSTDSTALQYQITIKDPIGNITAAHFHAAPVDSNGPAVKTIFDDDPIGKDAWTIFSGTWTSNTAESLTPALVADLCSEKLYVNVHTDSFPDGELRGQIMYDPMANLAKALPGVIYASLGQNAGDDKGALITIDLTTGAGTRISTDTLSKDLPALAINSKGEMYGHDFNHYYRIDAITGEAIYINMSDNYFEGETFDMTDKLYANLQVYTNYGRLCTVDVTTGMATLIGYEDIASFRGMAFDPTDGTLWISLHGKARLSEMIHTVDISTGKLTRVGRTGLGNVPALVFDEKGNLYGVTGGGQRPNDLISIDKTTGAGTVIGPVGYPAVTAMAMRTPVMEGPQLSLNARAIDLGNVELGKSSIQVITMTNYGTEDLTVSTGLCPDASFALTDPSSLPLTIPPRGAETIQITFTPAQAGLIDAILMIGSNDADLPLKQTRIFGRGVDLGEPSLAEPGVTYATTGSLDGGRFHKINPTTGAGSLIGPTGLNGVGGLAINNRGEIYAIDQLPIANLYRIDVASGAAIRIGSTGLFNIFNNGIFKLAFDGNNILYGTTYINSALFRIDTETGATTLIGYTGETKIRGLAFDPTDGILWASTSRGTDRILTIDTSTGEATLIGQTGLSEHKTELFFDAEGKLYGSKGLGNTIADLISIDKSTGAGTVIGSIGFPWITGMATRLDRAVDTRIDDENHSSLRPRVFALEQNYPNPFNPTTTIQYDLPKSVHVRLVIYNVLGRKIRTLADEDMAAGSRQTIWDARDDAGLPVGSGVYFYSIEAGEFSKTRKLMLIK